jgi:hypothetical protein
MLLGCDKIKEDQMAGHVARTGEMRKLHTFWFENLKGRDLLEDLSLGGRIILKLKGTR